jgi:hypothetical protein
MNPACDIASNKVDNIICLHIEPLAHVFDESFTNNINNYFRGVDSAKKKIENAIKEKEGYY